MEGTDWIFIGIGVLVVGVVVLLFWNDSRKRAKWAKDKEAKASGLAPPPSKAETKAAMKAGKKAEKAAEKQEAKVNNAKGSKQNESVEIHTRDKDDEDWLTRTYTSKTTNMAMLLRQEAASLVEPERLHGPSKNRDIFDNQIKYKRDKLKFGTIWESEIYNNSIVQDEEYSNLRTTQPTALKNENYRLDSTGELKPIRDQINDLSPEMKAMLFADILKRNDGGNKQD